MRIIRNGYNPNKQYYNLRIEGVMLLQLLAFINIHENSGGNGGCLELASLVYLTVNGGKYQTLHVRRLFATLFK